MRFGFFFFAEYVNVFIISALTVTLFFGGWNAPFPCPFSFDLSQLDPGSLGIGLLVAFMVIPPLLTLVFAAPLWIVSNRIKGWQALLGGFVLANMFLMVVIGAIAFVGIEWVSGMLWFMGKTYVFVFLFVWMRGTLPRVRVDQLMDFAWKWLLPASLLNLFVTAVAIVVSTSMRATAVSLVPGLGIVRGMSLTLRRFFEPKVTIKYPEVRLDPPHKFRGRLQLLYDEYGTLKCETCFQCAQACPIECIDMGGMDTRGRYHVHWGPPETYGERREESALRRSGRTVPDPAYLPFAAVDIARVDAVLEDYDHDPARMLEILEATQAAYGYLPVAALKRISQKTGAWYAMIYGTASYYAHLRFEPPEATAQAAAVDAHRPAETAYLAALRCRHRGCARDRDPAQDAQGLAQDPAGAGRRRRSARPGRGDERRRLRGPAQRDPPPRAARHDRHIVRVRACVVAAAAGFPDRPQVAAGGRDRGSETVRRGQRLRRGPGVRHGPGAPDA